MKHTIRFSVSLTRRGGAVAYVVSLQIEMREVQRDFELSRCYDFPNTTFVTGIQVRKRRTCYRAVGRFDDTAAGV